MLRQSKQRDYRLAYDGTTIEHRIHARPHMKVFVVEDSAPVRERLIEMIGEIGGCVVVGEAETGGEAVAGIRASRPDVAILDIQLAAGNGIDVLIAARREHPDLKAIVLTNYATPQHEKASAEAGADYFLDKSADFENIGEILETMKIRKGDTLK